MIALNANHPSAHKPKPVTPTPALDPVKWDETLGNAKTLQEHAAALAVPADGSIPDFLKRKAPKDMTPDERRAADAARKRDARKRDKLMAEAKATATANAIKAAVPKPKAAPPAVSKPLKPSEYHRYDWPAAEAKAAKGIVPQPPDFSANTHRYYRPILAAAAKAARARDLEALKAVTVKGSSTSPRAIKHYKALCLKALSVKP